MTLTHFGSDSPTAGHTTQGGQRLTLKTPKHKDNTNWQLKNKGAHLLKNMIDFHSLFKFNSNSVSYIFGEFQ